MNILSTMHRLAQLGGVMFRPFKATTRVAKSKETALIVHMTEDRERGEDGVCVFRCFTVVLLIQ